MKKSDRFKDITKYWVSSRKSRGKVTRAKSVTIDGKKYYVDGRNVINEPKINELRVAYLINYLANKSIKLLPRVNNPECVKTPDYSISHSYYDLKTIYGNGKNTIRSAIKKSRGQAQNYVIDISYSKMPLKIALRQIEKLYTDKDTFFVETIVVVKGEKIIRVYKKISDYLSLTT